MTHTYQISGMTCNSCVSKVKDKLLQIGDVLEANIQLAEPQASITMQRHIPTSILQSAISKAGNYSIQVKPSDNHTNAAMEMEETPVSYLPIFLLFAFIIGSTLIIQLSHGAFNLMGWMTDFMAGFFLVFSFFKLMDVKGFAEGYSTYDVIAKRIPAYGFIYPFIELFLGIAFLTRFNPLVTNVVALIIMAISTVGVLQSLLKKTPFQCACLGTVFKLPLGKVTLVEDVLMVLMSGAMIVMILHG